MTGERNDEIKLQEEKRQLNRNNKHAAVISEVINYLKNHEEFKEIEASLENYKQRNLLNDDFFQLLRNRLQSILETENRKAFSESLYNATYESLLILAKYFPINKLDPHSGMPECPCSLADLDLTNSVCTSTGYQFDKTNDGIVKYLQQGNTKNPATMMEFNKRDFAKLCEATGWEPAAPIVHRPSILARTLTLFNPNKILSYGGLGIAAGSLFSAIVLSAILFPPLGLFGGLLATFTLGVAIGLAAGLLAANVHARIEAALTNRQAQYRAPEIRPAENKNHLFRSLENDKPMKSQANTLLPILGDTGSLGPKNSAAAEVPPQHQTASNAHLHDEARESVVSPTSVVPRSRTDNNRPAAASEDEGRETKSPDQPNSAGRRRGPGG